MLKSAACKTKLMASGAVDGGLEGSRYARDYIDFARVFAIEIGW